MKILRLGIETIDVDDKSVKIACSLYNRHLLDTDYLSSTQYDDMSKQQKMLFLIEEAAIEIDKAMG